MISLQNLDIAVIGNEDQVILMQLAGVEKYRVIEGESDIREKVREALREFVNDTSIGIIMIPENFRDYVDDILKYISESKKITPIIIEIPSKFTTEKEDVREFYKSYAKKLLGFSIEI